MSLKKTDPSIWKGRETDPSLGAQYWYQKVEWVEPNQISNIPFKNEIACFGLLGYACDEGIRRNLGRVGAVDGPVAIRQRLAKLANHLKTDVQIFDVGDVVCEFGDMEEAQHQFAEQVSALLQRGITPIGIGGGHDISYAHFCGIKEALLKADRKVGIINFDAHFDLRPVDDLPNSGTPFRQILEQWPETGYLALGIQKAANTRSLFDYADSISNIEYVLIEDCDEDNAILNTVLNNFIDEYDDIYLTIDLDGFSSAYVKGVSAPSPFGWKPEIMVSILSSIISSGKLLTIDIAEMNPLYDNDDQTALLAALLINSIVMGLSKD